MSSIFSMFPGVSPMKIRTIPAAAILTGNLAAGKFVFDPEIKVDLHNSLRGAAYYVAGVQLAADVDGLVFSNALFSPIKLHIWTKNNNQRANQTAIQMVSFNDFLPLQMYYRSQNFNGSQAIDSVQMAADGYLEQTAALASLNVVRVFASLLIYEITDQAFIQKMFGA